MEKQIDAWEKRERHPHLRKLLKKAIHLILTFFFGVLLATLYHQMIINQHVRKTAETICENFGRDEAECKNGINSLLDESDGLVDNNININGD